MNAAEVAAEFKARAFHGRQDKEGPRTWDWTPRLEQQLGRLMLRHHGINPDAPDPRSPAGRRDPRYQRIIDRHARVREMAAEGLTISTMAKREGLSKVTIQNDLRDMGLVARMDVRSSAGFVARMAKREMRKATAKRMLARGKSVHEIAAYLDIAAETVKTYRQELAREAAE